MNILKWIVLLIIGNQIQVFSFKQIYRFKHQSLISSLNCNQPDTVGIINDKLDRAKTLQKWLVDNGGYVHPKVIYTLLILFTV